MLRTVEARSVKDSNQFGVAIASVVWRADELYRIVLVRRQDGAVALIEVPEDLVKDLVRFDRPAVLKNRWPLEAVVRGDLAIVEFSRDLEFGKSGLENGSAKAELGNLRRFNSFLLGVDIGEFALRPRYLWN
jgi:hypothetical protein